MNFKTNSCIFSTLKHEHGKFTCIFNCEAWTWQNARSYHACFGLGTRTHALYKFAIWLQIDSSHNHLTQKKNDSTCLGCHRHRLLTTINYAVCV